MPGSKYCSLRGASSALPLVIVVVLFMLVALGIWMWVDMNKHDLATKVQTLERLKKGGQPGETTDAEAPPAQASPEFICHRAAAPITIDGIPDDPAWRDAQVIDNFSVPWLGAHARPAKTKTVARILWDDQYFYFLAEMDDADVYADVGEHNGEIWYNDVFELFFKPSTQSPAYYEFEVNAKNATLDLFFPSRGSGGTRRWKGKFEFHLDTKVTLRPGTTLNDHTNRDNGWIVEGRIPWSDFVHTGGKPTPNAEWKFALCRYDYSKEFEEPELSTCVPLKYSSFHRYEDYATLRFVP